MYAVNVPERIEIIQLLIDGGASPNAAFKYGTPLHISADFGHVKNVVALIAAGADVNPLDRWSHTPLMLSARRGHAEIVRELLGAGADVNARNVNQYTALILAALSNHADCVRELLGGGADANARNDRQYSALTLAAHGGHTDSVRELLGGGADTTARDTATNYTALMHAAVEEHTESVKLLLDAGADADASLQTGETVLILVAVSPTSAAVTCAELVLGAGANVDKSDGDGATALHFGAFNGNVNMIKALLTKNPALNAQTDNGITALFSATLCNNAGAVEELVKAGADANITNELGDSALIFAISKIGSWPDPDLGSARIVKALMSGGTNLDICGPEGTALVWAADKGMSDIVDDLVKAGAKLEFTDSVGNTALIIAAIDGNIPIVKCLLAAGADVNARGRENCTALIQASGMGHLPVVDLLLDAGARADLVDEHNQTAVFSALGRGQGHVVDRLLSSGLELNLQAVNKGGMTALDALPGLKYGQAVMRQKLLDAGADPRFASKTGRPIMLEQKDGTITHVAGGSSGNTDFRTAKAAISVAGTVVEVLSNL